MKRVVIIGGGVVGTCSAWYLRRAGHKVTIIDQDEIHNGCSYGNAGMIVPSHFVPLAAPGMIAKGIRWMFNSSSPFYVRPALNPELLKWGWIFYRSATKEKVAAAAPVLRDISLLSKQCYEALANEVEIGFHQRGLLMLYRRRETGEEEMETVEMAHNLGMEANVLSPAEVQKLEPRVAVTALGGIYFPGDAHLSPNTLMTNLRQKLTQDSVLFIKETVVGIDSQRKTTVPLAGDQANTERRSVNAVITNKGRHECDEVVLAAGAWSPQIASMLGISIPMQAGKGYSFTLTDVERNITTPTIFLDDRVAVTPMGKNLRFGGTMEIGGINQDVNMNRVMGIVDAIPKYYPEMRVPVPDRKDVWSGLRPCSPDGLPFIGRVGSIGNLTIATGHGMMGVSLGPATGKLVAEVIDGGALSVDLSAFRPDRFS